MKKSALLFLATLALAGYAVAFTFALLLVAAAVRTGACVVAAATGHNQRRQGQRRGVTGRDNEAGHSVLVGEGHAGGKVSGHHRRTGRVSLDLIGLPPSPDVVEAFAIAFGQFPLRALLQPAD